MSLNWFEQREGNSKSIINLADKFTSLRAGTPKNYKNNEIAQTLTWIFDMRGSYKGKHYEYFFGN